MFIERMKFNSLIEQITNDFIDCWNLHDMHKLATYISKDIKLYSPNINKFYPENTESKLYKKESVMAYWCMLNKERFFKMTLAVLSKSDKIIYCEIDINDPNQKLYATFTMDEYCKFTEMEIHYK